MSASEENHPRTYAIRLTPRARADIDAAHARLATLSGQEIADEWQAGLLDAVGTLATMPRRCPTAEENRRFQQEVRQLLFRRRTGSVVYRILYAVVEAQEDAPVVRILHVRPGAARPITRSEASVIEEE